MSPLMFQLTDAEWKRLEKSWPRTLGHAAIEGRAVEIARIFLRRQFPHCRFEAPERGADLCFRQSSSAPIQPVEVKGTEAPGLAWSQLKVSSADSRKLLVEKSALVYRISDVFTQSPKIYILVHGKDFLLEPEARWAFKSARTTVVGSAKKSRSKGTTISRVRRSKYDLLQTWLQSQSRNVVTLGLSDTESRIGLILPASAYTHQAFWANQKELSNRPWARAWTMAGFRVEQINLSPNGWVRFRRIRPLAAHAARV
ncbi:MAG: hypothetical protein A3H32_15275 [Betaproteobacteria bacterium RIFCSPLOWO2_02_FULL_63_19]|nr:MAG: hypothetical protein A3H32_15275 [Betaproteobacteria bacterium RIFCSPLOWO2_02_FULL_63_19]